MAAAAEDEEFVVEGVDNGLEDIVATSGEVGEGVVVSECEVSAGLVAAF